MRSKNEIIWKDRKNFEIFRGFFVLLFIIFLAWVFYLVEKIYERIFFGVLIIILVYYFYRLLNRKFIFMNKKGIRIGNIPFGYTLNKEQTNIFIKWQDVDNLKFQNKVKLSPKGSLLFTYLILKIKNNKKYECLIYDPKGFIKSLKKLNKYHLLSKDSRYR